MLSRVAERVYWFARYLERVENTARLIKVNSSLLYDIPDSTGFSWDNLISTNGARKDFSSRYDAALERDVVNFLLFDSDNSGSMKSSILAMRENVRTTREVVSPESWELVNELHIYLEENRQRGVSRWTRRQFLDEVIKACQQINGLIAGTMRQDDSWQFLRLGRNLERADMTTRIIEAGALSLPGLVEVDSTDITDVVWGCVLRSVDAYVPYRRAMGVEVNGPDVSQFLVKDELFPRSVVCCLNYMLSSVLALPKHKEAALRIRELLAAANDPIDYDDVVTTVPEHTNKLQLKNASLHSAFAESWFNIE